MTVTHPVRLVVIKLLLGSSHLIILTILRNVDVRWRFVRHFDAAGLELLNIWYDCVVVRGEDFLI